MYSSKKCERVFQLYYLIVPCVPQDPSGFPDGRIYFNNIVNVLLEYTLIAVPIHSIPCVLTAYPAGVYQQDESRHVLTRRINMLVYFSHIY